MRYAVIGAGFAGLSLAHFLLKSKKKPHVTLFNAHGLLEGASGAASGLLHPYAGQKANFSYRAELAFPKASALVGEMHATSMKRYGRPIIVQQGVLRPALHQEQAANFQRRVRERYPIPCLFLSPKEASDFYPNPLHLPALFIPDGLAIDSQQYLSMLFETVLEAGVLFRQERVEDLEKITGDVDAVVVAAGYETKRLLPHHIATSDVKGQRIDLVLPEDFVPPIPALSAGAYAVFSQKSPTLPRRACLGSTFEHFFSSQEPDQSVAMREITAKVSQFWPELLSFPLLSVAAGIRATTPSSKPIVCRASERVWAITGLGSKGLLYHAWLSEMVASRLLGELSDQDLERTCVPRFCNKEEGAKERD